MLTLGKDMSTIKQETGVEESKVSILSVVFTQLPWLP
jgi:hypothetical protein